MQPTPQGTPASRIRVLLVEDDPGDAWRTNGMLAEAGGEQFVVTHVERLSTAIRRLRGESFDVILLDLLLPDSCGLETLYEMQKVIPGMPIIVLGRREDEAMALQAMQKGAQDYLVKGCINGKVIVRVIRYATLRKRAELRLDGQQATGEAPDRSDHLTFRSHIQRAVNQGIAGNGPYFILLLELENRSGEPLELGPEGPGILREAIMQRVARCLGKRDSVISTGSSEIMITLAGFPPCSDLSVVAHSVLEALAAPLTIDGQEITISAKLGLSIYPFSGEVTVAFHQPVQTAPVSPISEVDVQTPTSANP